MKNKRYFSNASFMRNRKANIPVTILVLGVVMICTLALISFFSSSFSFKKFSTSVSVLEEFSVKINEYNFYKSRGISGEQINKALDIEEGYLYMEKNDLKIRYKLP